MSFDGEQLPKKVYDGIDFLTDEPHWLWTGALNAQGYGVVRWKGRSALVHRLVYQLLVGPIPRGMTLDHECRRPPCCNPECLEPVTRQENTRRWLESRTTCKWGHPLPPYKPGKRPCKECAKRRAAARYQRIRADPERYARWLARTRKNVAAYKARKKTAAG